MLRVPSFSIVRCRFTIDDGDDGDNRHVDDDDDVGDDVEVLMMRVVIIVMRLMGLFLNDDYGDVVSV